MKLKVLSLSDVEQVRQWRNEQIEMLRTPFLLTQKQQEKFYHDVICNRKSNARYWGIFIESNEKLSKCEYDMTEGPRVVCYSERSCIDGCYFLNKNKSQKEQYDLIGMCGIENISWENRNAEISLIFNPEYSMDEYGEEALQLLLHEGFMNMNLENIYTEVYGCNPNLQFWLNSHVKYNGNNYVIMTLDSRKYWQGKYYDSHYITFNKERYNENTVS